MTVHRIKASDFKEEKRREGAIEIEMDDGSVFFVDPPELWPDEAMQMAQSADNVATSRLLIGEDRYDAFVAAGGSAAMVLGMIGQVHGASVPELRASASS